MSHAPDPLLPNFRTQSLKLLLLEKELAEPWWMKLARIVGAIWRTA